MRITDLEESRWSIILRIVLAGALLAFGIYEFVRHDKENAA
jgi:hypothetical protein